MTWQPSSAASFCEASAFKISFAGAATTKLLWEAAVRGLNKPYVIVSLSGFVGATVVKLLWEAAVLGRVCGTL